MNIFAQAAAGLPLTPAQRAFLKLLEGFFLSALLVAGQTFFQYLNVGWVDWQNAAHTALIAGGVTFLLAVAKYYKSHGDVTSQLVGTLASTAATALESQNPTLYTRAEQGAPATTNASGDAATVAVVSDAPAAALS